MNLSLDDLWLERDGQASESGLARKRRRNRIAAVGAVGASYLVDTLLLWLFCLAGTVDPLVPTVYGCAAAGHVILFSALHWSGFSERFSNSHMTVWQMVYAIAMQLASIAIVNQIVTFFLANMFVIFGFGTLRISLRQALTVWLFACLAVAATLRFFKHTTLGIASPDSFEVALVGVSFATFLLRTIALGYYATALRTQMYNRAHSLALAVDQAEHLATHDALTGLLNRRVVLPAIDEQIGLCGRVGIPACVAMLDIDRFKAINDRFGHLAGDGVLKGVAKQIGGVIRKSDKLARYGGEEFLLLLPATDLSHGVRLMERIRERIAASAWVDMPQGLRLTLSCGITEVHASDTVVDVVGRADRALYVAKNSGRNRVCRDEWVSGG